MDRKTKFFVTLLVFLGVIALVQLLGKFAMGNTSFLWYDKLQKPSFTPPKQVFPLVWTFLYFLIATAGALLFCKPKTKLRKIALSLWGIQLFFNLIWSFCFFTFQSPILALIDITFLWLSLGAATFYAYKVSLAAGWYLLLNFLWVSFAFIINAAIVALN